MKIEARNDGMIINIPTAVVTEGEGHYPCIKISTKEGAKIQGDLGRVYYRNSKLFATLHIKGFTALAEAEIQVRSVDFGGGLTGKLRALYATSDKDDRPDETVSKYGLTAVKTWSYRNSEPYEVISIKFTSRFKDLLIS